VNAHATATATPSAWHIPHADSKRILVFGSLPRCILDFLPLLIAFFVGVPSRLSFKNRNITRSSQTTSRAQYFTEREKFNPLNYLKNPMVLIMIATLFMAFIMPKMVDNMDEDEKKKIRCESAESRPFDWKMNFKFLVSSHFGTFSTPLAVANAPFLKARAARVGAGLCIHELVCLFCSQNLGQGLTCRSLFPHPLSLPPFLHVCFCLCPCPCLFLCVRVLPTGRA
jgi:hypothetical protein